MVLLNARKNVAIGNKSFKEKRAAFKGSALLLTAEIYDTTTNATKWGPKEVEKRQTALAKLAVKVWPV